LDISLEKRGKNVDNFKLKQELNLIFVSACLLMLLEFAESIPAYTRIFYHKDEAFPVHNIALSAGCNIAHSYIVLCQPVIWSFKFRDVIRKTSVASSQSGRRTSLSQMKKEVTTVLDDPRGYQAFKTFLVAEFSVENVLFYTASRRFRSMFLWGQGYSKEDIFRCASLIYDRFISPHGFLMLNLPGACREKIRIALQKKPIDEENGTFVTKRAVRAEVSPKEALKEIELIARTPPANDEKDAVDDMPENEAGDRQVPEVAVTLFDEAWEEILMVIVKDSFVRFRLKKEFQEIMNDSLQSPRSDNVLLPESL
jgi:hypothetical protein